MKLFWKIIKWILIILLIVVLLIAAFLWWLSIQPSAPYKYTQDVKTEEPLEKEFLSMGDLKVKSWKEEAEDPYKNFYIWYPENLETESRTYPVVLMLNGTGILPGKYDTVFKHLASYGFVVMGEDNPSSGTGIDADVMFERLEKLNQDTGSVFYGKLDLDNIGLEGHSQGGAGVLCAASLSKYKDHFKAVVALSPTHEAFAHQLGWNYQMDQITAPTILLAGTSGDFETVNVIPIEAMKEMYAELKVPKAMARRIGMDHGAMMYSADGVATAWLLYFMQNNQEAGQEFIGPDPELEHNPLYQDVAIDIPKN